MTMEESIQAAVTFIGRVIISSNGNNSAIKAFQEFKCALISVLKEKYDGHWHDDTPSKGQGYRSIFIHPQKPVDPVLNLAARQSKFSVDYLRIPMEFVMWIDPVEVSCRFGDVKPYVCMVLDVNGNKAGELDVDDFVRYGKAVYAKQQNIVLECNQQNRLDNSVVVSFGSTPPKAHQHFGYSPGGYFDNGMSSPACLNPYLFLAQEMPEGYATPPPFPCSPAVSSSATPRKNGKNGHFRKGNNGTGRNNKHHHHPHHNHHQLQNQNGDNSFANHNMNNSPSNGNMNTPNGSNAFLSEPAECFHLEKGVVNAEHLLRPLSHHDFYLPSTPAKPATYNNKYVRRSLKNELDRTVEVAC